MITVALAGTVFFSAPTEQQKSNVLLYLLMTVAPFAVIAPIIGPGLDRLQHGRRLVMGLTAVGRALLAIVLATNFHDLYVLFPAALGSLVLSKAYSVVRSAATPRLVPSTLTLVEANARLSIFGLGAALISGAFVGVAIKVTGSYPFGLYLTAVAFAVTAFYAFRLPKIVDALPREVRTADDVAYDRDRRSEVDGTGAPAAAPTEPPSRRTEPARPAGRRSAGRTMGRRLLQWSGRGFTPHAVVALQGESTLRWLSGFLTLFMAFYIERTAHGWQAAAALGALGAAMGAGNFIGTGIGTRWRPKHREVIILTANSVVAVACVITALFFALPLAILTALVSSVCNALGKLSLDAIIQRDVLEDLRSSAFGRSETFLQLAWVLGASIAILLPADQGGLGFGVAAFVTVTVASLVAFRTRTLNRRGRSARAG
jgi:hypothetical protein